MATRKSTRVAKAEELLQKDDTDKATKGSRKKRKTSNALIEKQPTRRARGNRGIVKFAIDIPFDVLLEIFRFLKPIDLLHLSRVSKSLHASLTSNDMAMVSLWKSAYENVSLSEQPPFCPDETNIVYYTNFLYGRHCQLCSSVYGRIHHESAFIRLCSKCGKDNFLTSEDKGLYSSVYNLCNQWSLRRTSEKFSTVQIVLKDEYIRRLKEFKQARKANDRKLYSKEREIAVRERSLFAYEVARWRKWMQDKQIKDLRAIRDQREADIKKKLEEEGFKVDSDGITYDWARRVPHARKPHALTDSEWGYIRADILDFFQDIREERALSDVKYELRRSISNLGQSILPWKIRPTPWWIASSDPTIASFIKDGKSTHGFSDVKSKLCDLITSWQEETDRYLATLIPQPSGKGKKNTRNSDTSVFELATTFFKCHWCTEPISYPRILMHACFLRTPEHNEEAENENGNESDMEDFEEEVAIDPRTRARGPRQPRPPMEITLATVLPTLSDEYSLGMCTGNAGVAFDEEASKAVRDIIMVCGEDPNTVTYAEMEESPRRLECVRCIQEKPKTKVRLIMKWNMALIHELEEHYGETASSEPAWRKIASEEELDKVERAESHIKALKKYNQIPLFCNHCALCAISLHEKMYHIIHRHNIIVNNATVHQHFSPPVDASIKMLYPAVRI